MSDFDVKYDAQEGVLELKNDNDSTISCKNLINSKLCKIDSALLKSLADTLHYSEALHENGWKNTFIKVGWCKSV